MADDPTELRWRQRREEFRAALALLRDASDESERRALSVTERAGLVQFFELTTELAWKMLAPFLLTQGVKLPTVTPLSVFRAAVTAGIVDDGDVWLAALKDRNLMSHTYDVKAFDLIVERVTSEYVRRYSELLAYLDRE